MSSRKAARNGRAGPDRVRESTIKAPPSDDPETAPQSPATCASGQSARLDAIRQAAGRVTAPDSLRYLGLAGAVGVAAAGTRPVGLIGVAVLAAAWLGIRTVTGTRWLLTTAGLWALPLLVAPPLFSEDAGAYACQGQLYEHGVSPYAHGVADLPCTWLAHAPALWVHSPSPYGPLWIALTGAAAATGTYTGAVAVLRIVALAGIALAVGYGYRLARILGTDPSRVAWLGAASPLVLLHGVSGVHNDALMAGLIVAGLAYAAVDRELALGPDQQGSARLYGARAGVLLGLALAVKVTALVAVPFAVSLLARQRRLAPLTRATAVVAGGAAGTFAAVSAATGLGLGWVPALSGTTTLVQWSSPPTGVGMVAAYVAHWSGHGGLEPTALAVARGLGLLVLAVILVVLWWRARTPRAITRDAGFALAATALLGPVFFPWYALAPLAVLGAALVWERWIAGIVAGLALTVLPNGHGIASMTRPVGAIGDVVLATALAVWWVRRLRAGRARPTPTAR
jgi:alpha-1,6-mannosyltransferase